MAKKKKVDKKRSAASKKGWATRRKNAKKTVKKAKKRGKKKTKRKGSKGSPGMRVAPSQTKVITKA